MNDAELVKQLRQLPTHLPKIHELISLYDSMSGAAGRTTIATQIRLALIDWSLAFDANCKALSEHRRSGTPLTRDEQWMYRWIVSHGLHAPPFRTGGPS